MSEGKLYVGALKFSVMIDGAQSLKDRRQVVRSLHDKLVRGNASVADLGPDGAHDIAELAAVCAGSSASEVEGRVAKMIDLIEREEANGEFELLHHSWEVEPYGDL